jgi:hypothetical protein
MNKVYSQGRPVGSIKIGRRFTDEEMARIDNGEDIDAIVASAPRLKTREEMYQDLFANL